MASLTNLQILRDSLLKMASGDARLATQLELLVSLTKFTGFGQSTGVDVALDATGVTFAAPLVVGRWFIDLVILADSVSAAVTIDDATDATVATGFLALSYGDGGLSVAQQPVDIGPTYITFGPPGTWSVQIRGFITVQRAGVFGFRVSSTGASLLAGSGLTCTIQREAP